MAFNSMDYIIITFNLVAIGVMFGSSLFMFNKARNREGNARSYGLAIAFFFLFLGLHRIIFLIVELTFYNGPMWNLLGHEISQIYQNNPDLATQTDINYRISSLLSMIGLAILTFELERYILDKKTKYIITILLACLQIPYFIFGDAQSFEISIIRIMFYIGTFLFLAIPLIYFYMASKTSGETKKRALAAGVGMGLAFFGIILVSTAGKLVLEALFGVNGIHLGYIMHGIITSTGLILYLSSVKY